MGPSIFAKLPTPCPILLDPPTSKIGHHLCTFPKPLDKPQSLACPCLFSNLDLCLSMEIVAMKGKIKLEWGFCSSRLQTIAVSIYLKYEASGFLDQIGYLA